MLYERFPRGEFITRDKSVYFGISNSESYRYNMVGSKLVFKDSDFAKYAGKKFFNLYKDFIFET